MNRLHLRFRFVSPRGDFIDMMDIRRTTKDPNRALMVNREQADNCLKLYPELAGFLIQEVMPSKTQVLR